MNLYKKTALIALSIAISAFYYPNFRAILRKNGPILTSSGVNTDNSESTIDPEEFFLNYNSPVVGKIEQFTVPSSTKTVVLIPQTHQSPGTNAQDKVNDNAEKAQNQIYQILSDLIQGLDIKLVMAEGDLYGEVPEQKIAYLKNLTVIKNKLSSQISDFEESNQNSGKNTSSLALLQELKTYLKFLDREIILSGAPYKLKAEGAAISLYGTENQSTLDKSAELVRDYTYLQDRKQQLANAFPMPSGQSLSASYLSLLNSSNDPIKNIEKKFSTTKRSAGLNQQALKALIGLETTFNEIIDLKQKEAANSNKGSLPSRTNNPYKNITDPMEIELLMSEDEKKIQSLIIDQRNVETADFALETLQLQDKKTIILQYGAGHVIGLVKELNSKGLSVIVVTAKGINKN